MNQVNKYERLFDEIEWSKDGRMTAADWVKPKLNGQKILALNAVIKANDGNGSGNLNFSEFLALVSSLMSRKQPKPQNQIKKKVMEVFAVTKKHEATKQITVS